MPDTAEAIIEAIRAAFHGVPRGTITIREAEVIDSYGSKDERREARRLDRGPSWERVGDEDIEACKNALHHLDPEGWRYYIPAYMIWTLRNYQDTDSMVPDHTIFAFCPDADLREYHLARFRLLDEAQSRAVCRFLRYMAATEDYGQSRKATRALEDYWGGYC